jgi:hypothetical protein
LSVSAASHARRPIDDGGRLGTSRYADTSKFELAHHPHLYPPDEIVARWELTSTPEAPAPARKPAQPGAAPR